MSTAPCQGRSLTVHTWVCAREQARKHGSRSLLTSTEMRVTLCKRLCEEVAVTRVPEVNQDTLTARGRDRHASDFGASTAPRSMAAPSQPFRSTPPTCRGRAASGGRDDQVLRRGQGPRQPLCPPLRRGGARPAPRERRRHIHPHQDHCQGAPRRRGDRRHPAGSGATDVAMVRQQLSVVPALSVRENLAISLRRSRSATVGRRRLEARIREALTAAGLRDLDTSTPATSTCRQQQTSAQAAASIASHRPDGA